MRLRQTTLSPLLRSLAAAMLVFWILAQTFCAAHCSLGVDDEDSGHASCHGLAPAHTHDDDGNPSSPTQPDSDSSACLILQSALVNGTTALQIHPEFHLICTLALFPFALDATETKPAASSLRHAWRRDWLL